MLQQADGNFPPVLDSNAVSTSCAIPSQVPVAHVLHEAARVLAYPELPHRQRSDDNQSQAQRKREADDDALVVVRS